MHFKSLGNWSMRFLPVQKSPQNTWHPQSYKLNLNSHFTGVSNLCYCVFDQLHPEGHLLKFWALLSNCQRSNSWSEKRQHIPVQIYSPPQNSLNFFLHRTTVQFHCISHKLCLFQKLVINYIQIWELELKKKESLKHYCLYWGLKYFLKSRTKSKASDQDWILKEINKS